MINELEKIFDKANKKFITKEVELFELKVSERTLCGALMLWLREEIKNSKFSQYYVDVEFNRNEGGKVKAIIDKDFKIIKISSDLVVHGRGKVQGKENLISLEMKKSSRKQDDKDADRHRLIALTREAYEGVWPWEGADPKYVCGYELGVYYEIDYRNRNILLEYYSKGEKTKSKIIDF